MRRDFYLGMAMCVFTGCGGGEPGGPVPANSRTIAASSSGRSAYVISADDDSVVSYNLDTSNITRTHAGRVPARIARSGDRVLVTLRGERAVAVLREAGEGELVLESKINVGAEPIGIVAASDGKRAWVAASLSGRVDELDLDTLSVSRSFEISGEPRWLALHPGEYTLYVSSAYRGVLTSIDLASGYQEILHMPRLQSAFFVPNDDGTFGETAVSNLAIRFTGDPAVSSDGARLLVPAAYIDHQKPVFEHAETTTTATVSLFFRAGYEQRMTPVVFQVPLEESGRAIAARARPTPVQAFLVTGPTGLGVMAPFSYPTSVTVSPDNEYYVVTFESSSGIVRMPMFDSLGSSESGLTGGGGGAASGGTTSAP